MQNNFFKDKLTSLCSTLCNLANVPAPELSAPPCDDLLSSIRQKYNIEHVDRILMYNPDAIGDYIYDEYHDKFKTCEKFAPIRQRFCTVFPPKTPVCFASMYTGATPQQHGIQKYEKPVVTIDSIFDAYIRAGKKPCIVSVKNQSMDRIFAGKKMDYFPQKYDDEVVEFALKLIEKDEYDLICVYNQRYDDAIHRSHPKSKKAQHALDCYSNSFVKLCKKVEECWTNHDTLVGFATDHGTHRMIIGLGNHGKNIPKDMNISHLYGILQKKTN